MILEVFSTLNDSMIDNQEAKTISSQKLMLISPLLQLLWEKKH